MALYSPMGSIRQAPQGAFHVTPDSLHPKKHVMSLGPVVSSSALPANGTHHASAKQAAAEAPSNSFWGEDGFSFGDLIDMINPLQHIPVVSSLYRSLTGDEASAGSRLAGGAIFGGVGGLVSAFFHHAIEEETGQSLTEQVVAWAKGDEPPAIAPSATPTEIATRAPSATPNAALWPEESAIPTSLHSASHPPPLPATVRQTLASPLASLTPAEARLFNDHYLKALTLQEDPIREL